MIELVVVDGNGDDVGPLQLEAELEAGNSGWRR
jgi:hypothetical protein